MGTYLKPRHLCGWKGKGENIESAPSMSEQPRLVMVCFIWCCALVRIMVFGFYSPRGFCSQCEIFYSVNITDGGVIGELDRSVRKEQ